MAAWTFLTHSHGNYSTLCLCSLYFLTASPFKWLCAKLKQAFFSPTSPPYISPTFFFPSVSPLIYPITYSELETHTGSHTHLHPNYILPFVYRQEPFVTWNTQPGLLLHKFLQLLSCIRTHTALQVQYMTGGGLPGWYYSSMDRHKAFKQYYSSLSTCM